MCLRHTRAESRETLQLAIGWSQSPTTVADELANAVGASEPFWGGGGGLQAESDVRRPSGRVAVGSRHCCGACDVGLWEDPEARTPDRIVAEATIALIALRV